MVSLACLKQCEITENMNILEIGCGSGALWKESLARIPNPVSITLSDISRGMLRDTQREIGTKDSRFSFRLLTAIKFPIQMSSSTL